jgi:hypothetical protein
MVSKVQERIYAESAIELLAVDWQLAEIPEPLDFEVRSNGLAFGLEIRQVFVDAEQSFGSPAKREESKNIRSIIALASQYYALGGLPISAKFLGSIASIEMESFAQELVAVAPSYPGESATENIQGVKVFMNPLPLAWSNYSRWIYVDDRVGWVRNPANHELQEAVNRKEGNLRLYKLKYEDIDLLLVADRSFNSGRLQGGNNLHVSNPGFRTIYFLSYPESIQRVG